MKILRTGGHATPALAVIEELQKRKDVQIIFVGRQYTVDNELTLSYEYTQVEKLKIPFIHLTTGKFSRSISLKSILNIGKIFIGILQSRKIIHEHKPDAILTFGGYIGFPIALAAHDRKIPVYIHEQTINPGLTNRLLARIATKIFIAFPQAQRVFPSKKTILTGNPIRISILKNVEKPFIKIGNNPILFIMGGTLGSHSLNVHIENILEELTKDFIVIHQTGNIQEYNDFERLSSLRIKNYFPAPHMYQNEIGWVYKHASIVVSRAGANTVFELMHFNIPSVLVPLPWSAGKEQDKHAYFMHEAGVSEVFDQSKDSEELLLLIKKVFFNNKYYQEHFPQLKKYIQDDVAAKIVHEILQ